MNSSQPDQSPEPRVQSPEPQPRSGLWNSDSGLLFAALLATALLRLAGLDLVSWTNDEGAHDLLATHILGSEMKDWPLAGLPSLGIRNSAFFVYLLAIAKGVVLHPLSGAAVVAVLNTLAVYLAFRLTDEQFGRRAAWIVLVLYACSPWSVIYARTMWPPSCLAVFCLLLLRQTFRWLETGRGLFSAALLATVIPQVHFSGFCAPIWLATAVVWGGKRAASGGQCAVSGVQQFTLPTAHRPLLHVRSLLAGVGVGLVTWAPWIAFQQISGWVDFRTTGVFVGSGAGWTETLASIVVYGQALLHSSRFDFWFNASPAELPMYFPRWLIALLWGGSFVLTAAFVIAIVDFLRRKEDRRPMLLMAWLLVPAVALLLLRVKTPPHYLLITLPVPFILVAAWLTRILSTWPLWARRLTWAFLAVNALAELAFLGGWSRFVNDGQPAGEGHYRQSYRQRRDVVLAILDDAAGRPVQLLGPFSGLYPAYLSIMDYELIRRRAASNIERGEPVWYWVDDAPVDPDSPAALAEREAEINRTWHRFRDSASDVSIVDRLQYGAAVVYRLQLHRR